MNFSKVRDSFLVGGDAEEVQSTTYLDPRLDLGFVAVFGQVDDDRADS
ncbi:hypothetical protein [Nonomuraea sp. NPDC049784]